MSVTVVRKPDVKWMSSIGILDLASSQLATQLKRFLGLNKDKNLALQFTYTLKLVVVFVT